MVTKVHGRRSGDASPLEDAAILQRTVNRLRRSPLVPKGVHRFATHEEAERWMIEQTARLHARRSSRT